MSNTMACIMKQKQTNLEMNALVRDLLHSGRKCSEISNLIKIRSFDPLP